VRRRGADWMGQRPPFLVGEPNAVTLNLPAARAVAAVLVLVVLVALPRPVAASTDAPPVEGSGQVRLVVHHAPDVAQAALASAEGAAGAHAVRRIPQLGVRVVETTAAEAAQVQATLEAEPGVVAVEVDQPVQAHDVVAAADRTPNDTLWSHQWGLRKVGGPAAWDRHVGTPDTVVAVLDTGVDALHPDLAGNVLPGYDATLRTAGGMLDLNGHGTHVAGTIAALTDNDRGVAGMCWQCAILPVKVLSSTGSGSLSDVAAGIVWAADNGADVINMSLGGTSTMSLLHAAVQYAASLDVVLVASAGNDGVTTVNYPAGYPEVIAVASSTSEDTRSSFSNHGSWVDVAAPGSSIASTVPGGYGGMSGTSMAAPHVAGAAALLRSFVPGATAASARTALEDTAVHVGSWVEHGRIDVDALLATAAPGRPGTPVVTRGDRSAVVKWSAPSQGASPISSYTVTASPGGATVTVAAPTTSATVDQLRNGTSYTFEVAASNTYGTGPASAPSAATTPAGAPLAPPAVVAVPGERSIAVTWEAADANGSPLTGYHVILEPTGTAHAVDATTTSVTFSDLDPSTAYTASVTASNALGTSAAARSSEVVPGEERNIVALTPGLVRTAGGDRFATAAAVSAATFSSADVVYVATGGNYPDALAGGAAAGALGAPILLVAGSVPSSTAQELARLSPDRIVVLGGRGAVSDAVMSELGRFAPVSRLSGADRFATAAAVSKAAFDAAEVVYVATGGNYPDALAGGPAAGATDGPILLVSGSVPASTADELARLSPERIVVLGGRGVVSDAVVGELERFAPVTRVAGADRFATAAAVSQAAFDTAEVVYVATGGNYPDALAGGPAAGATDGPILLVSGSVPAATAQELTRLAPRRIVVLGGPGAVSDAVFEALRQHLR
jgi:minor extracellular protease Epr